MLHLRPTLTGLPAEIRQKIFRFVMQPEDSHDTDLENRWLREHLLHLVVVDYPARKPPRLIKAYGSTPGYQLLYVSRTCYQDAAPLLYERGGFYLFNDFDWSMWFHPQPFFSPPSFESYHMAHPVPNVFAFIRELGFQPLEISASFVSAIERNFPSLAVLRAFRHVYLHEPDGRLTPELSAAWREFLRFVLLAARVVTTCHSTLKHAKWCDWRFFPYYNGEDSIRTMMVKLTPDNLLSSNEEGLLDLERIAQLPLSDNGAWNEAVTKGNLRIVDFLVMAENNGVSSQKPRHGDSRPQRIRSSDCARI